MTLRRRDVEKYQCCCIFQTNPLLFFLHTRKCLRDPVLRIWVTSRGLQYLNFQPERRHYSHYNIPLNTVNWQLPPAQKSFWSNQSYTKHFESLAVNMTPLIPHLTTTYCNCHNVNPIRAYNNPNSIIRFIEWNVICAFSDASLCIIRVLFNSKGIGVYCWY